MTRTSNACSRLGKAGYETAFAADGISALSEARKESPDLIILDLGLPAGDGFTVLERLNALPALSTIPVIVLSARDPQLNRQRALDAGATVFVEKPLDMNELLENVRTALETDGQ